MKWMKQYYDVSVKLQRFEEGTKVLVFDPKKRGQYAKRQAPWKAPMMVKWHLNHTNSLVEIDEKPTIYRSCGPYVPLSR